jgi:hypothetical protein
MHPIFARFEGFQDPGGTDLRRDAGVLHADSPRRRDVYRVFNPRKGSAAGAPALAGKLAAAAFETAILFAAASFPVSGYVGAMAMGTLDFYGCQHDFTVFFCDPVLITPLSYFVDHLLNFLYKHE